MTNIGKNSAICFGLCFTTSDKNDKCVTIMLNYTKTKTIRITETQHKTLQKMKRMNVDVGRFVREAIKEKIEREYHYIIENSKEQDYFLKSLNEAIKRNE